MAYEASITPSYIKEKVPRGELFFFIRLRYQNRRTLLYAKLNLW